MFWWEPGDDAVAVAVAARERAPALAQARVPSHDVAVLVALQDAGFRVVDATVTLAGRGPEGRAGAQVAIRDAVPGDADDLLHIAEQHYDVSRFHLDPQIPGELAGSVKRAWLQAYFDGTRGDRLLVATRERRPVGFIAGLYRSDSTRVIDLVALHPALRGAGAGRALVGALAPDGEAVEAGTQLANTSALRFYGRLGFTVATTEFVLHLHG